MNAYKNFNSLTLQGCYEFRVFPFQQAEPSLKIVVIKAWTNSIAIMSPIACHIIHCVFTPIYPNPFK